jgi:uncharacterized protein
MDRVLAFVFSALVAWPVLAGADAENAAPSPLAVDVSRFVLSRDTWARMQRNTAEQAKQQIARTFGRSGTPVPPEFGPRFEDELGKALTYDEVTQIQARLLGKHYTASELKGLLAFYKTPLGQKVIRVMPEVTQDASEQMLSLYQQRLPQIMERLKPLLEKSAPGAPPQGQAAPPAPSQEKAPQSSR